MNKLFKKAALLAAFPLMGFALFYLIPYLYAIDYSLRGPGGVGLQNFRSVLSNRFFLLALKNTAIFVLTSVPILLILGYFFAELATRSRYGGIFNTILFLPALIPSVASASVWSETFSQRNMPTAVLLFVWKNAGLITLILTAGRRRISGEILDAASIDGAGFGTLHRAVIFPLMLPALFFSALVGLLQSFKIFREIYLLYNAYPPDDLYMLPHYIFNKFNKLDYGELSAGTILFTLLLAGIAASALLCARIYTGRGRKKR